MKKLILAFALVAGFALTSNAQQGDKFVAAGGGIFAPGCTNCDMYAGFNLSGGYGITDNIVATLDFGLYSNDPEQVMAIGVTGKYYVNEAFNGFYFGPDVYYTNYTIKDFDFNETNVGFGLNMGYNIAIGESLGIEPYLGYGSWLENAKGRVAAGLKLGYKF